MNSIKKILLLLLAVIPYALGWITGKIARVIRWIGKAFRLGWDDAHKQRVKKTPKT